MIKLLLWLLSSLKFIKLGKLLTTGGTMLVSVVVYAFIWGWRYAAGFVALMFVHEMGHYLAARQRGLAVGAPTFIPFVGAWIQLKQMPHDAETEAYVGLAGPLVGTAGALACYVIARDQQLDWLLAVAYSGFFLNLFNLIPLSRPSVAAWAGDLIDALRERWHLLIAQRRAERELETAIELNDRTLEDIGAPEWLRAQASARRASELQRLDVLRARFW